MFQLREFDWSSSSDAVVDPQTIASHGSTGQDVVLIDESHVNGPLNQHQQSDDTGAMITSRCSTASDDVHWLSEELLNRYSVQDDDWPNRTTETRRHNNSDVISGESIAQPMVAG